MTNYDKLRLEVWTDGSITPREAVSLAAKIMTEHLMLFVNLSQEMSNQEIMKDKQEESKTRSSKCPLKNLICRSVPITV